ncbi:hypothetical protein HSX10_16550 [Winogradskyella undariae]|uniref:hypothetical protein n=1 Tax=Winogradskyella undariae TaxID=1285465 RepID=UPI00156B4AB9|nr:hypothetical protein [Winogradskyella undariae]NRR93188.1 hypothetical protein [Winogradskyella undariae]QNK77920.1 hypothetical protein H7F37_02170 [Winogradskyella sp. PAMC22761]
MPKELKLEIKPQNFSTFILKSILSILLILFLAFILFAIITPNLNGNYTLPLKIIGVLFILILVTQFIFSPTIYLYSIRISETTTELKWQKNGKYKYQKFNNAQITTEIVPSGKNNPYLKLEIKDKDSQLILKQHRIGEWTFDKLKKTDNDIDKYKAQHISKK